jgi:hypothetical protein
MNIWEVRFKTYEYALEIRDWNKLVPFSTQIEAITLYNPLRAKWSPEQALNNWHPEDVEFKHSPDSLFSRYFGHKPEHFIRLYSSIVCISKLALKFVEANLTSDINLLPLYEYGARRKVHLIYVKKVIDCLDKERSECVLSGSGRVIAVEKYHFNTDLLQGTAIFRIPEHSNRTLVNETFIEAYEAANLNDLVFQKVF